MMLTRIRQFLELIRFSHTVFALPFALLAALMAWRVNWLQMTGEIARFPTARVRAMPIYLDFGWWRWEDLVGILMCMVAGRSAAMAFNRLADRRIDALNPRTAQRHLPAGILRVQSVAYFALVSSAAFVASTLMFLPNRLPLYISLPTLGFLIGYSYTKRFTVLSHFWLGAALGLAPVLTWVAIRGEAVLADPLDVLPGLVLGGAVMLWVAGFDMIYACQDVEFDRSHGLHSVPARLGVAGALRVAAVCHAGMVGLLLLLPIAYPFFGWVYWIGAAAIAGLLIYEHALVRPDDLARVNTAFFNVNAVVSVGLLAVGAAALWF